MPPLDHPFTRPARAGFTLIELVIVAVLIIFGTSVMLTSGSSAESHVRTAHHKALQIKSDIADALATAEAEGGDVLLLAEVATNTGGAAEGRFAAAPGARGMDAAAAAGDQRVILDQGTRWGAGQATTDPLGGAVGTYSLPTAVRCSAGRGCNLGLDAAGEPRSTLFYYITHAMDPGAVVAIALTPDGVGQIYRRVANGTWTVEAPR